MDLKTLTYIVVGATFALYIGIAFWARAASTGEFYAAGRGVHPVANGMATAADWMSAASFISMAGLIAFMGYGGSVFLMGWTGGYVLLAMLLAPYLRKFGKFTVPEFIGDRYYSKAARIVAVVCLIIASVTYVIGQMKGIGVAFSRFLDPRVVSQLVDDGATRQTRDGQAHEITVLFSDIRRFTTIAEQIGAHLSAADERIQESKLAAARAEERAEADLLLAFGKATWPHLMARAMLAEQLYRATTILAGHP